MWFVLDRETVLENVRQALELNAISLEILRQRLRRRNPGSTQEQIEGELVAYLKNPLSKADRLAL